MICTSSLFYWLNYKKTRVAFQNRVNQVAWITNPASHTLVSNSMSYFKRGDVSLSYLNWMIDLTG